MVVRACHLALAQSRIRICLYRAIRARYPQAHHAALQQTMNTGTLSFLFLFLLPVLPRPVHEFGKQTLPAQGSRKHRPAHIRRACATKSSMNKVIGCTRSTNLRRKARALRFHVFLLCSALSCVHRAAGCCSCSAGIPLLLHSCVDILPGVRVHVPFVAGGELVYNQNLNCLAMLHLALLHNCAHTTRQNTSTTL